jgi:hypothetical protein
MTRLSANEGNDSNIHRILSLTHPLEPIRVVFGLSDDGLFTTRMIQKLDFCQSFKDIVAMFDIDTSMVYFFRLFVRTKEMNRNPKFHDADL